jgi:hypothetical protein
MLVGHMSYAMHTFHDQSLPDAAYLITGTHTSYTLHWYKKRGAAALKSINTDAITSMTLLFSGKPLVYSPGN